MPRLTEGALFAKTLLLDRTVKASATSMLGKTMGMLPTSVLSAYADRCHFSHVSSPSH